MEEDTEMSYSKSLYNYRNKNTELFDAIGNNESFHPNLGARITDILTYSELIVKDVKYKLKESKSFFRI